MKRAKTSGFVVDLLLTVEMQPTKPEVFKRALRQKTAGAVFASTHSKTAQLAGHGAGRFATIV
jgi:hypothetical protein